WIPSTPLHVQMYRAFGWQHPEFCHLPMVNGADGKKLSKRHGSTSLNEFRARGYLPQAIVNYVALLGCSYEEGKEFYTLDELARHFSLEHLNKASAVFDYKKLEFYNGNYIRQLTAEELYHKTLPFITGTGDATLGINPENPQPKPNVGPQFSGVALGDDGEPYCVDESMRMTSAEVKQTLMGLMPLIQERLKFLTEAAEMVRFMFTEPAVPPAEQLVPKKLDAAKTKEVLERAKAFVAVIFERGHDEAEAFAKAEAESLGVKLGDFMMPIRMAVTGSRVSPPLIGSIAVLGREKALVRIARAVATL
ncbi:MAG: glutamate--tRNA ligase, partial [Treponemataceae bacterium]|nr:glutamate--tRNA ligase [Treponemataceae bacterium]